MPASIRLRRTITTHTSSNSRRPIGAHPRRFIAALVVAKYPSVFLTPCLLAPCGPTLSAKRLAPLSTAGAWPTVGGGGSSLTSAVGRFARCPELALSVVEGSTVLCPLSTVLCPQSALRTHLLRVAALVCIVLTTFAFAGCAGARAEPG